MSEIRTVGLTWRDLDERFPELERRELHDGVLVVTPSPAWWHQDVVGRLYRAFADWADEHGGKALTAPLDVVTAENRVYQPDVLLVLGEHLDRLGDDGKIHEPPDLIVEVSSPSTRSVDLLLKLNAYAAFGVIEYWFVDLDARAVLLHRLEGGRYADPVVAREGDVLTVPMLPGFELRVARLLR